MIDKTLSLGGGKQGKPCFWFWNFFKKWSHRRL